MKFTNIEDLINHSGNISIGRVGSTKFAAVACDEHQCLAMLARKPSESLMDLLKRLDSAIDDAYEQQIFLDEING